MSTGFDHIGVAARGNASVLLSKAYRWTWIFAAAGAGLLVMRPGLVATGAAVTAISMTITALCMFGAQNPDGLSTTRAAVQRLAPVLVAFLLWLAMVVGSLATVGSSGAVVGVATISLFAILLVLEGLVAAAFGVFLASIADNDPAIGVSLQVADKYAGFLGELV